MVGDAQAEGHLGQDPGVDHRRPDLGHLPVGEVRVAPVAELGHHQAEDGVTQELEALVGDPPDLLRAPRPVGHGLVEQAGVVEPVADPVGPDQDRTPPRAPPSRSGDTIGTPQAPPSLA